VAGTSELLVESTLIAEAQECTTIGNTVSVHHESITKLEHLRNDIADVLVLEFSLIVKDVDSVEDKAVSIKDDRDTVLLSKSINLTKVAHREAMASRTLARKREKDESNGLGLRKGLGEKSDIDLTCIVADGLDIHAVVKDVSLGSCRRTIAQNDALLVRIGSLHYTANRAEQEEFSSTLLRNKEEVGTRELKIATIDKATSFRMTKLNLRRSAVFINDDFLDESVHARLISGFGLENVTDRVEDCEITVVATIGLITTEEGRPLDISQSNTAAVAEEIASNHGRRESVIVVAASAALEGLETLLSGGGVIQTNDVGGMSRNGNTQLLSSLKFRSHSIESLSL